MRYTVVGRHAVLGKRRGEVVYLDGAHADRLVRAGHVTPADEPEPPPRPIRRRTAKPKPRPYAGLSHDTPESAAAAEEPEE